MKPSLTLLHEGRAGLTVYTVTWSKTAPSSPHNLSSPQTWVAAWARISWESKICSSSLKLVFLPGVNRPEGLIAQPLSHNNYGTYFPSWLRIRERPPPHMLKLSYNHNVYYAPFAHLVLNTNCVELCQFTGPSSSPSS